ncbi:hypothetical protein JTF06_05415 [Desemzia sp. RIT804]|uniref:hypothetical protein n=1 Tax=Desemzia sp. RIT 804 TaxID=2810209 RepID=UPI00194ED51A|nr:hypothetical protein [Desemzia sp. RIT 804]MBM6614325.1 hypothetical protein [Desemzia sp. RIT 804]
MKKIKKYFPLIIGLVLLLSVAAYGTRAYFTDSTKEEAGIKLTLGHIDIQSETKDWIYENYDGKDNNNQIKVKNEKGETVPVGKTLSKTVSITNVKPGDSFSKTFTFTNKSSLKSVFTFTEDILRSATDPFEISYKINGKDQSGNEHDVSLEDITNNQNSYSLDGNESVDVVMTLKVATSSGVNDFNFKSDSLNKSNIIDLMTNSITVMLEQAK